MSAKSLADRYLDQLETVFFTLLNAWDDEENEENWQNKRMLIIESNAAARAILKPLSEHTWTDDERVLVWGHLIKVKEQYQRLEWFAPYECVVNLANKLHSP